MAEDEVDSTQFKIGTIVNQKELEQRTNSITIQNRAQAKLQDLEDETHELQETLLVMEKESEMAEDNIARLHRLKKKVDANIADHKATIAANLLAINSLRQAGVKLLEQ